MTDIVERLRGWAFRSDQITSDDMYALTREAADEIERQIDLRNHQCKLKLDALAEIERLRNQMHAHALPDGTYTASSAGPPHPLEDHSSTGGAYPEGHLHDDRQRSR